LHKAVTWLTGYNDHALQSPIEKNETFKDFFKKAKLNPNRIKITGTICGYCAENIENQLTQNIQYLDKLVAELAKGKPMENILIE
jgi:hypothetical protein